MIHSRNATKRRLNKYLSTYIIHKDYIHVYIVYSEKSTPDPRFNTIIAYGCSDDRFDLDCRDTFSYNFFRDHSNLGDFLYRAIDDTFLNITNLENLINQLRSIYNPQIDLVFRGFANDEDPHGRIFLGGRS